MINHVIPLKYIHWLFVIHISIKLGEKSIYRNLQAPLFLTQALGCSLFDASDSGPSSNVCVRWGGRVPTASILRHQLGVLQFNSVLTPST